MIPAALSIESDDISEKEFLEVLMEGLNREQYDRYVLVRVLRYQSSYIVPLFSLDIYFFVDLNLIFNEKSEIIAVIYLQYEN